MTQLPRAYGYRNADDQPSIRVHVVALSLSAFCNTVVHHIASSIAGVVPLVHPHGRNEIGLYRTRLERSLEGAVLNPNVHAALIVGYEPDTTRAFAERIAQHTRKPIETVVLLESGTLQATCLGSEKALDLVVATSGQQRQPLELADLVFAIKCGGSDTTSAIASNPALGHAVDDIVENGGTVIFSETTEIIGAEHILARRAVNGDVARRIQAAADANENLAREAGVDLVGTNPVPDNIRGGITTIEEKSLGAILKVGTAPLSGVVDYAERPPGRGLYFMDSPSAAAEVMTGLMAAGAHAIVFSTGTGNPAGSPIAPVLKVTGNPRTVERMRSHIDVDVSDMLMMGATDKVGGDRVLRALAECASGRLTRAEVLGHREFAPIPVGL